MTRFRFKVHGSYVIGYLTVPTEVGALQVATLGGTKADALMRAATVAQRIVDDPVMAALMPPQAAAAIKAAKALSSAARQGPQALRSLWGRIKGPGKKRLAEALAKEAKSANVGALYFGERSRVRQPNRGAWQEWLDPDHDDPEAAYEDGWYDPDDDYELGAKRRKRRKGKRRYQAQRAEPEAPTDEPEPPVDDDADAEPPIDEEGAE